MTQKLNSAARLFRVLDQAKLVPHSSPAVDGWVKLLDVNKEHPLKRVMAVSALTQAMHQELQFAVAGLQKLNFPPNLYDASFSNIENSVSPLVFGLTWVHVLQYLTPETLTALAYCAQILPDEESQISKEEIVGIQTCLAELKESLVDSSLSERLRLLIEHHVALIEQALFEYPISGAMALREAGRTALGEMIEVRVEILEAKDHPATYKLEKTWKTVNSAADIALKAEKLAQLGQRAWDALSNFL